MSYVILNCPAFDSKYNECHSKIEPHKIYCKDCTDCVMKQIVERCKRLREKNYKEQDTHLFSENDLKILDRIWFDTGMGCKKIAMQIAELKMRMCE